MKNRILKKRILKSFYDLLIFIPIFFPIIPLLLSKVFNTTVFNSFVSFPFMFILYFGIIPKITNGYTLGGLFSRMKIISINNERISIYLYIKRTFFAIYEFAILPIKGIVRINKLGQLNYDKKFNTTVLPRETPINILEANEVYIYNFIIDIVVEYIKLFFILFFTLYIFQKLFFEAP